MDLFRKNPNLSFFSAAFAIMISVHIVVAALPYESRRSLGLIIMAIYGLLAVWCGRHVGGQKSSLGTAMLIVMLAPIMGNMLAFTIGATSCFAIEETMREKFIVSAAALFLMTSILVAYGMAILRDRKKPGDEKSTAADMQ
jgi:hypothetical protein